MMKCGVKNTSYLKMWLLFIIAVLSLSSCSKKKGLSYKGRSQATGWDINGKANGFKVEKNYKEQDTAPGLVFIEGGSFVMGQVKDDVMGDWNTTPKRMQVRSFYMDETEVTNAMYLEYLYWLRKVFPPSYRRYIGIYKGALPDTMVWRNNLSYNEVYVENYLRHPGYRNYPVVGVNWLQAMRFCEWRTDRVNEKVLIDKGSINDLNNDSGVISGANHWSTQLYLTSPNSLKTLDSAMLIPDDSKVITQMDGVLFPKYRLPTEAEWEYAALAQAKKRDYNSYLGKDLKEFKLRAKKNSREGKRGDFTANFKQYKGDYSGIGGWANDGSDITSDVKKYTSNDFGLFGMFGNVAEWVADVYRPIIDEDASDMNYYRGNVFTKTITPTGRTRVERSPTYDTLFNGKLLYKTLPGEIKAEEMSEGEVQVRYDIDRVYAVDFKDGDKYSQKSRKPMYNHPVDKGAKNERGDFVFEIDDSPYRTTLISDKSRVIKGGSWKDRAYWLDPAQRRFMNEELATAWIGFRCAMDRVGSSTRQTRKAK